MPVLNQEILINPELSHAWKQVSDLYGQQGCNVKSCGLQNQSIMQTKHVQPVFTL